jgi:hypothetical protein
MHVFITSSNHHVIDMLIHEQVSGNLKCSFFLVEQRLRPNDDEAIASNIITFLKFA